MVDKVDVLDSGFVRLVDCMGDDTAIVQAARVSYGAGTKTKRGDERLIRYLMKHDHTSPFEQVEFKFHMKLPLFVARQMVRHRTASLNEVSGRYSVLDDEFYVPRVEDIAEQSTDNKQGRGTTLTEDAAIEVRDLIQANSEAAYQTYTRILEQYNVSREIARLLLPVNLYTQWYWKIDLHNLFRFLKLRLDSHAQFEIREYARAIAQIVQSRVPVAYGAFCDRYELPESVRFA